MAGTGSGCSREKRILVSRGGSLYGPSTLSEAQILTKDWHVHFSQIFVWAPVAVPNSHSYCLCLYLNDRGTNGLKEGGGSGGTGGYFTQNPPNLEQRVIARYSSFFILLTNKSYLSWNKELWSISVSTMLLLGGYHFWRELGLTPTPCLFFWVGSAKN